MIQAQFYQRSFNQCGINSEESAKNLTAVTPLCIKLKNAKYDIYLAINIIF